LHFGFLVLLLPSTLLTALLSRASRRNVVVTKGRQHVPPTRVSHLLSPITCSSFSFSLFPVYILQWLLFLDETKSHYKMKREKERRNREQASVPLLNAFDASSFSVLRKLCER
jgi:hypothetical protein